MFDIPQRVRLLTVEQQAKIGKEGFPTYRAQYVYSLAVQNVGALAKIWEITTRAIQIARQKDAGSDRDWDVQREAHRSQVAEAVNAVVKRDAEEEAEGSIATFQSVLGMFARHVTIGVGQKRLGNEEGDLRPSELAALWRVYDGVLKAWDRLAGYDRVREIAASRKIENDWFLSWATENLQDDEQLRRLARAVRDRMIIYERQQLAETGSIVDTMNRAAGIVSESNMRIREAANVIDVTEISEKDAAARMAARAKAAGNGSMKKKRRPRRV